MNPQKTLLALAMTIAFLPGAHAEADLAADCTIVDITTLQAESAYAIDACGLAENVRQIAGGCTTDFTNEEASDANSFVSSETYDAKQFSSSESADAMILANHILRDPIAIMPTVGWFTTFAVATEGNALDLALGTASNGSTLALSTEENLIDYANCMI